MYKIHEFRNSKAYFEKDIIIKLELLKYAEMSESRFITKGLFSSLNKLLINSREDSTFRLMSRMQRIIVLVHKVRALIQTIRM